MIILRTGTSLYQRWYGVILEAINKYKWKVVDEKNGRYPLVLFDYSFLTEGAHDEFLGLDHIYPEEFPNILEASDHILVVLDLMDG